MEKTVIDQLAERIFTLLGERLGVRGKTLETRFRKAGRLVPKRAREPIRALVDAQNLAQNPNMAMRIDPEHVSNAYDQALRELTQINPAAERSQKRFNFASLILLQLLLVAGIFAAILRWRGFL